MVGLAALRMSAVLENASEFLWWQAVGRNDIGNAFNWPYTIKLYQRHFPFLLMFLKLQNKNHEQNTSVILTISPVFFSRHSG